jgi:hypothetical protein
MSVEKLAHQKNDDLLVKVAELYTNYRDSVRTLPRALSVAVEGNMAYYNQNFFGEAILDSMSKLAAVKSAPAISSSSFMWNSYSDSIKQLPRDWEEPPSNSLSSALLGTP